MRPHTITVLCFGVGLLAALQLISLFAYQEAVTPTPAAIWIASALATFSSALGLWAMRSWAPLTFFCGFGVWVMVAGGIDAQWLNGWLGQTLIYGAPAIYALLVMPHWGQLKSGSR